MIHNFDTCSFYLAGHKRRMFVKLNCDGNVIKTVLLLISGSSPATLYPAPGCCAWSARPGRQYRILSDR